MQQCMQVLNRLLNIKWYIEGYSISILNVIAFAVLVSVVVIVIRRFAYDD